MNLDTRLTIPTQVMSRLVGEETVLLDLASGHYFGLDNVGKSFELGFFLSDGRGAFGIFRLDKVEAAAPALAVRVLKVALSRLNVLAEGRAARKLTSFLLL